MKRGCSRRRPYGHLKLECYYRRVCACLNARLHMITLFNNLSTNYPTFTDLVQYRGCRL